jgi:hypothetical protein
VITRFEALLFLALAAGVAQAQADAVPRPDVKPGDSWSYRRVDRLSNRQGVQHSTVSFANDRVIQLVVRRGGDAREYDSTYTADWNLVSSARNVFIEPDQGVFRFPLRPGEEHRTAYDMKRPDLGAFHIRVEENVKVAGWEEVAVPAGKFRALRIEGEGPYQRLDVSGGGTIKEVQWYAPEVKRIVKWTYQASTFRGPAEWFAIELVAYELK